MSKLETIVKALEGDPRVVITDKILKKKEIPVKEFDTEDPVCVRDITYFVAPREPYAMNDVGKLQALMLDLVPDLEPSSQVDYQYIGELSEGRLIYEEKLEEETSERILTLTDQEVIDSVELEGGQSTTQMSRDYMRSITIRFFPNESIAKRAFERASEI